MKEYLAYNAYSINVVSFAVIIVVVILWNQDNLAVKHRLPDKIFCPV